MDNQALAKQVGASLQKLDKTMFDFLGFELVDITPGRAVISMLVRPEYANSGNVCQGGFIFALADQAFAYACMSGNKVGMTLSAEIIYSAPAHIGDTLTATATVTVDGGRTATCDANVHNQDQRLIAQFRGINYRNHKQIIALE